MCSCFCGFQCPLEWNGIWRTHTPEFSYRFLLPTFSMGNRLNFQQQRVDICLPVHLEMNSEMSVAGVANIFQRLLLFSGGVLIVDIKSSSLPSTPFILFPRVTTNEKMFKRPDKINPLIVFFLYKKNKLNISFSLHIIKISLRSTLSRN